MDNECQVDTLSCFLHIRQCQKFLESHRNLNDSKVVCALRNINFHFIQNSYLVQKIDFPVLAKILVLRHGRHHTCCHSVWPNTCGFDGKVRIVAEGESTICSLKVLDRGPHGWCKTKPQVFLFPSYRFKQIIEENGFIVHFKTIKHISW